MVLGGRDVVRPSFRWPPAFTPYVAMTGEITLSGNVLPSAESGGSLARVPGTEVILPRESDVRTI
jgi:ATP-dependent Lon protease